MTAIKVTYDRESFIKLSDVGKKLAEKYCNEHPKEKYDCDDFIELYHMKRQVEFSCGAMGSGNWDEHNFFFDRIIDLYDLNENGE